MPYQKINSSSGRNPPYFVGCSAAGCTTTSARGEHDSLALRIGFSYCLKHLELSENKVRNRVNDSLCVDLSMITVIFYSLQLSANGQVEQLSAFALTGENFSAVIKTTIRATQSPNLKVIPPEIFDVIAEDLTAAITRFLQWTRMVHSMRMQGNQEMNNILLTAHGGACGDHVYLIRAMLACGMS
ncbi:hypothetical protein BO71DRAFT_235395 [Aspergillus ellipticus CBS 707.79]|uniref:Uncharacterized protein n=1 Tax=Aspergillus ellipticus CBS 707.79 TaxID=1448320 RepID=A0A319E6G0_9EURO|nr:hypothetical protein BO71DRAFT_235395 [Aspergillus ellipticus CBS 707.79]